MPIKVVLSTRYLMSLNSISLVICTCIFLVACELTPSGGSLYHASAEIGNTYTLEWPRRIQACQVPLSGCFSREEGSFTVDNAAIRRDNDVVFIHLVFENGSSGWMVYKEFLQQQFTQPAKTRLVAKLGMTTDQIRSIWGEPPKITQEPFGSGIRDVWDYPVVGLLHFKDGKLNDLSLFRSLLVFN